MRSTCHRQIRKTTWFFRLLVLAVLVGAAGATTSWWARSLARALACSDTPVRSDVILLENLEPSYLLFERAEALHRQGYSERVLVLVRASAAEDGTLEPVAAGFVKVMADVARLKEFELLPFQLSEPITLTAARQVRVHLEASGARSVLLLSNGFRSRRGQLVFSKALAPAGIDVHCVAVWGPSTPDNWTQRWHAMEEVFLQAGKLLYYRLWVL